MLNKMKINYKGITVFSALVAIVMGFAGCKKYDNPPPVFEEMETISPVQRKVIVVSIDGLTGLELKTIAPPAIEDLKKTAKFNYEVLIGEQANDVAGWATMATGVSYSKHLIKNDDFLPSPKANSHEAPAVFRNVLDYILQYKSLQTAIVTPWPNLRNYLRLADFAPVVSTDLAVKDSVINILNKQTQIGALMVNFRDVEAAGDNGGFVASNANYKNAVLKADEYLGNIVTAIKARKSYTNEDWLIVVTTNHGGSSSSPQPGFLIASNKNLKSEEVRKRGLNSVLFKEKTSMALAANSTLLDGGSTSSFTVQMDVKFNAVPGGYSSFMSKSTNLSSQVITGWQWDYYPGGKWVITVGGTGNSGVGKTETSSASSPGTAWHTLTMTINTVGAVRTLAMYIDGNPEGTKDISTTKSLATSELFRVGHRAGDNDTPTSFYSANLVYFNTALSAATIKANQGLKDITTHPNFANVVGYWPMDEGGEAIFANKIPTSTKLSLGGLYSWAALGTDVPPSVTPDASANGKSIVLSSGAVGATMLYWLNINILPEFGIDGNPFLNQFEIEFLK
jgi:hypothetical protein